MENFVVNLTGGVALAMLLLALYGLGHLAFEFGKLSYRWTCAVDELIKQRKERKINQQQN